jgi:hypothetical protein
MFLDLRAVSNIKNLVENMKNEINLTKTEKKLEYFLIIIGILSLSVIGFGIYFQNNNINKDYLLVPTFFGLLSIFMGTYAYNGLTDANLIKKWTPFPIYDIIIWIVSKNKKDKKNVEKITDIIISLIAIFFSLLLLILLLKFLK